MWRNGGDQIDRRELYAMRNPCLKNSVVWYTVGECILSHLPVTIIPCMFQYDFRRGVLVNTRSYKYCVCLGELVLFHIVICVISEFFFTNAEPSDTLPTNVWSLLPILEFSSPSYRVQFWPFYTIQIYFSPAWILFPVFSCSVCFNVFNVFRVCVTFEYWDREFDIPLPQAHWFASIVPTHPRILILNRHRDHHTDHPLWFHSYVFVGSHTTLPHSTDSIDNGIVYV